MTTTTTTPARPALVAAARTTLTVEPAQVPEWHTPAGRQPREQRVACALCGTGGRGRTMTGNWSGLCDRHDNGRSS